MVKWIDELRRGWHGTSQPSTLFKIGFALSCLAMATAARWCLALIRPDVFFTPYFPAVFFSTAFGGLRVSLATALAGGVRGVSANFARGDVELSRPGLAALYR